LNLVWLDPDVKAAFPDSQSVNQALRLLIKVAQGAKELSKASQGGVPASGRRGLNVGWAYCIDLKFPEIHGIINAFSRGVCTIFDAPVIESAQEVGRCEFVGDSSGVEWCWERFSRLAF
jgi:hypothetical protein